MSAGKLPQPHRAIRRRSIVTRAVVGVGTGFAVTGQPAPILRFRDSVTVIADVLRELCMPDDVDLGPAAVLAAVDRVNAGTRASSSSRLQPSASARRRLLLTHEY